MIKNMIFGRKFGRDLFKMHELRVIDSFREKMPLNLRSVIDRQISAIGAIQRLQGGTDVNCYSRKGLSLVSLNAPALNLKGETRGANIFVVGRSKIYASIWFVDGKFFCLEFDGACDFLKDWVIDRCDILEDFDNLSINNP